MKLLYNILSPAPATIETFCRIYKTRWIIYPRRNLSLCACVCIYTDVLLNKYIFTCIPVSCVFQGYIYLCLLFCCPKAAYIQWDRKLASNKPMGLDVTASRDKGADACFQVSEFWLFSFSSFLFLLYSRSWGGRQRSLRRFTRGVGIYTSR